MTELKLLDPSMISKTGETTTDIPITIVDSSLLTVPETAEAYEGVLVRVENGVVTHDLNDDGEWKIDNVMVDDLFDYRPGLVNVGDSFDVIQGILHFSRGDYKIVPRADSDVTVGIGHVPDNDAFGGLRRRVDHHRVYGQSP